MGRDEKTLSTVHNIGRATETQIRNSTCGRLEVHSHAPQILCVEDQVKDSVNLLEWQRNIPGDHKRRESRWSAGACAKSILILILKLGQEG